MRKERDTGKILLLGEVTSLPEKPQPQTINLTFIIGTSDFEDVGRFGERCIIFGI
jgi:hypothetical protein